MVQRKLAGRRCRAIRFLNTQYGPVPLHTQGTIRHETNNLGRHIVFVSWDHGLEGYVFPREIELLNKNTRVAADLTHA
ncbi:MAG: hypothetical protein AB7G75_10180 [Candidatus Binatia bacterium]